jgi:site-specific recombinase XerD
MDSTQQIERSSNRTLQELAMLYNTGARVSEIISETFATGRFGASQLIEYRR